MPQQHAPGAAPAGVLAAAGRAPPGWLVPAALAAPSLVAIAALRGLTRTLPIFHGSDEASYHVPTILRFAAQLPHVDLVHYAAAQTPAFHLLMALVGRVVGLELWRLRLVEALLSYLAVLVLYRLLRRARGLSRVQAGGLAALFALSPYFFGTSFVLMTDNLALLLSLLAIERLDAFRRGGAPSAFGAGCAWIALAVLTRQSAAWLALLALLVLAIRAPAMSAGGRLAGVVAIGAALAPFAALALAWHGLVPPLADAASCGLCRHHPGFGGQVAFRPLRPLALTVAIAGLYGAILYAPSALRAVRGRTIGIARMRAPALAALAAAVALLAFPLGRHEGDEGYLWRIASHGPLLLGTSWVFWILVPAGATVLVTGARREGAASLPVLVGGAFLACCVVIALPYQKYFDPLALLTLLLAARATDFGRLRDWAGALALGAAFVVYALSFVV